MLAFKVICARYLERISSKGKGGLRFGGIVNELLKGVDFVLARQEHKNVSLNDHSYYSVRSSTQRATMAHQELELLIQHERNVLVGVCLGESVGW
jgi:hypothetical protein